MDIFQNIDRKMMIVCLLLYPIVDHCPSESLGQNDKVFAGEFIFYFRDNWVISTTTFSKNRKKKKSCPIFDSTVSLRSSSYENYRCLACIMRTRTEQIRVTTFFTKSATTDYWPFKSIPKNPNLSKSMTFSFASRCLLRRSIMGIRCGW